MMSSNRGRSAGSCAQQRLQGGHGGRQCTGLVGTHCAPPDAKLGLHRPAWQRPLQRLSKWCQAKHSRCQSLVLWPQGFKLLGAGARHLPGGWEGGAAALAHGVGNLQPGRGIGQGPILGVGGSGCTGVRRAEAAADWAALARVSTLHSLSMRCRLPRGSRS